MQNAVLMIVIAVVAVAVVLAVVVGRRRRAWATGSVEAGSVRSRRQAREIADRVHSTCANGDGAGGDGTGGDGTGGGGDTVRVRVRGAARLMQVLRADSRFDVADRSADDGYWSFAVAAPGDADRDALSRRVVDILARNEVTAAPSE